MSDHFDCITIGAGPAGSTAAALIADAGHRVLLLERERMPRFHVGESLMPETYWTLERLGVLDQLRQMKCPPKVGVQFVNKSGRESQPFFFDQHDPRECSTTWHVERADFDHVLYKNASAKGADCRDCTRVLDVKLHEEGNAASCESEVTFRSGETTESARARVVIDATGQQAMLANRLGLKVPNERLRKAAIWTYYRGAERSEDPERNTTIILQTADQSAWFWYIPLSNDIVSIGVVGDHSYMLKGRGSPEQTFEEELAKCAAVQRRIQAATRCGEIHIAKEFSYTTKKHAGDGWVMIGDAFGFIDPVYSSGVFLALKSGEMAADAVVEGLRLNDLSAKQLESWTGEFKTGMVWMRKLVEAFYTNEFSFGQFMKEHPEHQGNLTDLLIGRVFQEGAGAIFDDLDPALEKAKTAKMAST